MSTWDDFPTSASTEEVLELFPAPRKDRFDWENGLRLIFPELSEKFGFNIEELKTKEPYDWSLLPPVLGQIAVSHGSWHRDGWAVIRSSKVPSVFLFLYHGIMFEAGGHEHKRSFLINTPNDTWYHSRNTDYKIFNKPGRGYTGDHFRQVLTKKDIHSSLFYSL